MTIGEFTRVSWQPLYREPPPEMEWLESCWFNRSMFSVDRVLRARRALEAIVDLIAEEDGR